VPDTQLRGAGGALSRFVGSNQQDRFLRVTPIHRVAGVWGRLQKLPHRFQRVKRGVPAGRCVTMTEIVEAGSTVPAAGATGGGSFGHASWRPGGWRQDDVDCVSLAGDQGRTGGPASPSSVVPSGS
jgi:hypothetical protein